MQKLQMILGGERIYHIPSMIHCKSQRHVFVWSNMQYNSAAKGPTNLKEGVMVFCFVQKFVFGQHESSNFFFCCAKREIFFQNLTLGYMTKTLNQIIILFLHQNQNIFFSNIGNQNIFLEKNLNPSPQVKWSFPYANHEDMVIV